METATGSMPQVAKKAQIKEHFGQFDEIDAVTLKNDMATSENLEKKIESKSSPMLLFGELSMILRKFSIIFPFDFLN
jgi:hypothetical protein